MFTSSLKDVLKEVVAQQVVVLPREASEGLNRLAEKRKDEIDALKEEIAGLQEELKAIKLPPPL